ncbi:protein artichoke-like [Liolophura sinensis]|uniref:protein artichoke-like n=1 Tax=Liolophura sinensis TaxID=3198878 RepID=UPI0031598672
MREPTYGLLTIFVSANILLDNGRGQCPVDPRCNCQPRNNSYINCYNVVTGEVAKFLPTNVYFQSLSISGNGIDSIAKGAFKELPVVTLTFSGTGMSHFECRDFNGLENSLTQLSLLNNAMLSTMPRCAIANLKKMTSFTLTGGRIRTIRNEDFLNLTLLETLNLESTCIDKIESDALGPLHQLTYLSISYNKIAEFEGLPFRGLISLKSLDIRGNEISGFHVRTFDQLTNLQRLYVDNNALVVLPDTLFLRNTDIETISLGRNQISSLPETILNGLGKLQRFSVSHNLLSDLPLKLFEGCSNLIDLDVSSNMLTYLQPKLLRPLTKLRTLNLENNRISSIADNLMNFVMADAFRHLTRIAYIYLHNNSLSTLQSGAFRNLTDLIVLTLTDNKLTEIPQGVLTNSSVLQHLFASNNHIRNIPQDLFEESFPFLYSLYLDNNHVAVPSILHLFERLPVLQRLRILHMSHAKLPPLSADIVARFVQLEELRVRNCSLKGIFPTNGTGLPATTDLSNNNLKGFGDKTPVEIIGQYNVVKFNVSNNDLTQLGVIVYNSSMINIYAENNGIHNLFVAIGSGPNAPVSIRMRNNRISTSVSVTNIERVYLLDLSYNNFTSAESSPVNFTESHDTCALRKVHTLNLSRNAILHISPEACLGGVLVLDLSHNQLKSLGALTPVNKSSVLRLNYLYLAGNQLHTISSETFVTATSLQFIDLRSNQVAVIPDLRSLLSGSKFRNLYLSDNPLRCDCTAAWLRNTPISLKIDKARCHSPPDKELFLLQCYDVNGCGTNPTTTSELQSKVTLCKEDYIVVFRNLTADIVDKEVIIHWSVQGPGTVLGYRLTYELGADSNDDRERLYHPEERSAVLSGLLSGYLYNICIEAQVYPDSRTERVCMDVEGTANVQNGFHLPSMALGIALGACLLINITFLSCLVVRSKHNVTKSLVPGEPVVRRDKVGGSGQEQTRNTISGGSLYETID